MCRVRVYRTRFQQFMPTNPKDEVTFLSHIRGGGLDLVQWQLPATKNQTMSEATYGRRYTDGARSAAG